MPTHAGTKRKQDKQNYIFLAQIIVLVKLIPHRVMTLTLKKAIPLANFHQVSVTLLISINSEINPDHSPLLSCLMACM